MKFNIVKTVKGSKAVNIIRGEKRMNKRELVREVSDRAGISKKRRARM